MLLLAFHALPTECAAYFGVSQALTVVVAMEGEANVHEPFVQIELRVRHEPEPLLVDAIHPV
jgi:hypothetical protein